MYFVIVVAGLALGRQTGFISSDTSTDSTLLLRIIDLLLDIRSMLVVPEGNARPVGRRR